MVYHNIKPACMLLVKYNDAGSRPCMTWYTLIYCRPLLWEHLLRFGSSSSSRLWSSSLHIVVTTMILFSEEWERVAGYRFPQQSVTPLVARSLDGHTAHFTMCRPHCTAVPCHRPHQCHTLHTAGLHTALITGNALPQYVRHSVRAIRLQYYIQSLFTSPHWPVATQHISTNGHSRTQFNTILVAMFFAPFSFAQFSVRIPNSKPDTLQFTVCLASSNKPQENWNMISFIYMYLVPAHHIRGLRACLITNTWHQRCQRTHLCYCICVFALLQFVFAVWNLSLLLFYKLNFVCWS